MAGRRRAKRAKAGFFLISGQVKGRLPPLRGAVSWPAPLLFLAGLASCAGAPPLEEYAVARSAVEMAKKHEGDKWSPESYKKAISLYKKGRRAFQGRYYRTAENYFEEAVRYAERAENTARLKNSRHSEEEE